MAKTTNIFGAGMVDMMAPSPNNTTSENKNDDIFNGDVPCKERNRLIPLEQLVEAPAEWNEYPPVDNETFEKMMDSMLKYGQLKVAMVREEEPGKYMIIGGHNRYRVLKALHEEYPDKAEFAVMKCNVYTKDQINDDAFRLAIVEDNEAQRAKENTKLLAIGYTVRKTCYKNSSVRTYGLGLRQKLRKKYNLSNGVASRIEQIGKNLIRPYINMYVNGEVSQNDAVAISTLPEGLQKYLLEKNIRKLKPSQRKLIAVCDNKAKLDEVLNIKTVYSVNGIDMDSAAPQKTVAFKLFLPKENQVMVLEALQKAMSNIAENNELDETGQKAIEYNLDMLAKCEQAQSEK